MPGLEKEEAMVPRDADADEVMCPSPWAEVGRLGIQMECLTRTPTHSTHPHVPRKQ